MGWFNPQTEASMKAAMDEEMQKREELMIELSETRAELSQLRRERDSEKELRTLQTEIETLKKQKVELEISKAKLVEDNDRKIRETEHLVGLQQRRADFEKDSAKRDAVLTVREENLSKEREEFDRQLKFNTERYEKTEIFLREMFGEVLKRLPDIDVSVTGGSSAKTKRSRDGV